MMVYDKKKKSAPIYPSTRNTYIPISYGTRTEVRKNEEAKEVGAYKGLTTITYHMVSTKI